MHQSYIGTMYSRSAPKSSSYRKELQKFISKSSTIIGTFKEIHKETIDNTKINQIMLSDVTVMCDNKKEYTDHIWITVEKGFMDRNKLRQQTRIMCNGYFYEYLSRGKRNIGFRLITANQYNDS